MNVNNAYNEVSRKWYDWVILFIIIFQVCIYGKSKVMLQHDTIFFIFICRLPLSSSPLKVAQTRECTRLSQTTSLLPLTTAPWAVGIPFTLLLLQKVGWGRSGRCGSLSAAQGTTWSCMLATWEWQWLFASWAGTWLWQSGFQRSLLRPMMPLKTYNYALMVVPTVSALTRRGICPCPLLHSACSFSSSADPAILHWHKPPHTAAHSLSVWTAQKNTAGSSLRCTTFISTHACLISWPLEMQTSLWQHTVHRKTWKVFTRTGTDGGSIPVVLPPPPIHSRQSSFVYSCCVLWAWHWFNS